MKATHKHKHGFEDRVFHLVAGTTDVFVKIDGRDWKRSAWCGDLDLFNRSMVRLVQFKGNK